MRFLYSGGRHGARVCINLKVCQKKLSYLWLQRQMRFTRSLRAPDPHGKVNEKSERNSDVLFFTFDGFFCSFCKNDENQFCVFGVGGTAGVL